ncbi:outer membrane protein assembly factor BamB family protein [Paenibacillus sp. MMS18-CY102]|uniref:outer membrane protein assembly factor BamB family protein n=1 Tax=Paenibacillus sp. MMS18-CY102 TaxID=2682849 RepID=UPI0013667BCE|nr:PQQ-binding-like beta-propeller repeat protein [Paenibacillus sp. MMS18-CY102]MWC30986.1 PQQ-binding-like beta-propeller repeat protein [Paenibacillus sp. MMS18-CY102]
MKKLVWIFLSMIMAAVALAQPSASVQAASGEWAVPVDKQSPQFLNVDSNGGIHYISADVDKRISYYRYYDAAGKKVFSVKGKQEQVMSVESNSSGILLDRHLWGGIYLDLTFYDRKGNAKWTRHFNSTLYVEEVSDSRILLRAYPGNKDGTISFYTLNPKTGATVQSLKYNSDFEWKNGFYNKTANGKNHAYALDGFEFVTEDFNDNVSAIVKNSDGSRLILTSNMFSSDASSILYLVDANKRVVWKRPFTLEWLHGLTVRYGRLYLYDDKLYCIDMRTGKSVWEYVPDSRIREDYLFMKDNRILWGNSLIDMNGKLIKTVNFDRAGLETSGYVVHPSGAYAIGTGYDAKDVTYIYRKLL